MTPLRLVQRTDPAYWRSSAAFRADMAEVQRRVRKHRAVDGAAGQANAPAFGSGIPGEAAGPSPLSSDAGRWIFGVIVVLGSLAWGLFPWMLGGVALGLGGGLLAVRALKAFEAL